MWINVQTHSWLLSELNHSKSLLDFGNGSVFAYYPNGRIL